MKTTKLLTMAFAALVVCSCQTPMNINYFQDLQDGQSEAIQTVHEITVQPEDQLSIVVNSKDPLLADLFNLPIVTHRVGYSQQSSLNTSQSVCAYTVDHQGQIDFPVLGKVTVAGKNREQIAALIKSELIKRNLVNDPVVTVEFGNLYVSVLGEVARPGRFPITRDKVTILDAISQAGDLTIYGKRENVCLMREENGHQNIYRVDLTNGGALLASPAYYLQQKDVIYVEPNDTRARQSTVNGNNVRSTSFWISLASLATSVAVLIVK